MADFLKQILNFMGTFNLTLVCLLFLLCFLGEILLASVPYLLETVWLMAGYNLSAGVLSPFHLLLLWFIAVAGRESGVLLLYSVSRFSSLPLTRLYKKYLERRFKKFSGTNTWLAKISAKLDAYISPFTIALGRLIGLATPLTVLLGVKKHYKELFAGVLLSSLIFDGIFIIVGLTVGTSTMVKPTQMILFSLIGLTAFYLIVFGIRQLSKYAKSRRTAKNDQHQ
jgi:membrane-associated protein